MQNPKRALISGACGFVGHHLVEYLLQHTDWELVCIDRMDSAGNLARLMAASGWPASRKRLSFVWHDLRALANAEVAGAMLAGSGAFTYRPFDYVIHMAAGSHVDRSVRDPLGFLQDNVIGTTHLLELCRSSSFLAKSGKVLVFSTDEVGGSMPPGTVFRSGSPLYPMNPYAATKAAAEMMACSYAATYSMPLAITRCTNVIGERQHREKFLPLLVERVKRGVPVPIHTVDGQPCSRYYNYHRNVSTAVLAVLERGATLDRNARGGRYQISGDREVSNLELAERVGALLGKPALTELVENPPGRIRPDLRYCVDDSELRELGWRPEVSFEQGLELTVRSYL